MLCSLLKRCVLKIKNIDQPGREPVFKRISGSTEDPGVVGQIFYERKIVAYEVFTVPHDRIFVLEHVSAVIIRSYPGGPPAPYPSDRMNDYGAVGYVLDDSDFFHFIPFSRSEIGSEPNEALLCSQSMHIYIPSNARVIVKVPALPIESGGAEAVVSGYYIKV